MFALELANLPANLHFLGLFSKVLAKITIPLPILVFYLFLGDVMQVCIEGEYICDLKRLFPIDCIQTSYTSTYLTAFDSLEISHPKWSF